jgi:hypothetical protein
MIENITLNPDDLRSDTFRNGSTGGGECGNIASYTESTAVAREVIEQIARCDNNACGVVEYPVKSMCRSIRLSIVRKRLISSRIDVAVSAIRTRK